MKFSSRSCRTSVDHLRAEICLITSSYLKWPLFPAHFSAVCWVFSADLNTTSHISNAYTFRTRSAFIPPAFSELLFKMFLRSLTVSYYISSSAKISLSLYFMTILSEDITNNTRQVSETVILLCWYLPGLREPLHDVCAVTIPRWHREL